MNNLCYPSDGILWSDADFTAADAVVDTQPDLLDICEALAWMTMQTLSGYRLGLCPTTVRPAGRAHRRGVYFYTGSFQYLPTLLEDGSWINMVDRGGLWENPRELTLPGPVGRIDNVTIDGVVLDPDAYRIDNGNILVREDGDVWPYAQNMDLPLGEVGTFSITYLQGFDQDMLTNMAANTLAHEQFKLMTGAKGCRLPAGTKTVARQGITYDLLNDLYDNGFTGIPEVDRVLSRFNPYKLKSAPVVMSPDSLRQDRTPTMGRF